MGYIKKLKNNELVGGTDKTTIYPVTSTKAVFEEVTEGDKSSFKSQEIINSEHDGRIKGLENVMPNTIKSITINGGQRVNRVDENGNVDLTIYSDGDQDYEGLTEVVADLRDIVGENPEEPQSGTLLERVDTLEDAVGTGGSVDQRISDAVTIEKNRAESIEGGLQTKLSVGAGITLTSDGVISATADPSVAKVVEARPITDIVDGMIYLVQTETPGTYKQWVHSNGEWVDKGNISLGITTDDTLDSTSSNPIQNAAIAAQIGYFVCGNGYASSEIKDVDALGFNLPDVGGDFKIKMNAANTHAGPVYLRFNSSNDTKAELKYNRESVSPTNTWEAEEVISVYYDGSVYQASNAQGDGGKAEKIKYDNSQSRLKSTNVQKGIDEIGNEIFSLGNPSIIPAGTSTQQYYTYQNGEIAQTSSSTFRCWPPIDISKYYALKINFYLPVNENPAAAKTFFTDENDVMVGDFLFNTSGDYMNYIVPDGAKKLYWTVNYRTQSTIGLKGVKRINKIDEKVDKGDYMFTVESIETYAGQEYHNGEFTSVSDASCRKYDVSDLETVYVSSRWLSQSTGYYQVVFTDESEDTVSQLFPNEANVDSRLVRRKVTVPENAKYMYVNSRYSSAWPLAEIEGSGKIIEDKINANANAKEISMLFIGNSLTQDAVTYVPLLLRELAPDLKFKLYIWYNGGYKLSQQLADFNNNVACKTFSICEDGISWANFANSVTMASVLTNYKFDIISIQEYFNYQEVSDTTTFNSVVEYIENHYAYPFKVVTLFHQPKRDTPAVIFERTKAGNALFLKNTVAEDMIPSGIAIYRALSTSLDSLGDQGHLSPDGTHAQEGLPCMMQAYVTAMWILKQVGIPMSVNNASSIVDASNFTSLNIPGTNPIDATVDDIVIGTTEQIRLSQLVAIKAFKEGEYFVNANLTEYTT